MTRAITSIFVIFCFNISAFCQSNFKDGYVITNRNDTLSGLIDFRTDHTNSLICKFKRDEKSTEKVYSPCEIAGYRFVNEGKYYVSRIVEIDSLKRTVFLEFLVQGLLNLYYFPEGNGYYFFENKNGEMISTTKMPDVITDQNRVKVDNKYKGIISYVLRDDATLAAESSNIDFSRKSMIEYTKEYHDHMCESGEKCIIFENDYKKKFTKLDVSFFSGIEFNDIKFNYVQLSKMFSFSPVVGMGLNVSSPRFIKSLSLLLDVTLSKIAGACDYASGFTYSQFRFSGIKSTIYGGLEYIYHKGKIRPAINTGFSYCYLSNLNCSLTTNSQISENERIIPQSLTGLKTEIGVDYQIKGNQFIIVRLMYSKHKNYYDINNTYQLKLGYKF